MIQLEIDAGGMTAGQLKYWIQENIKPLPVDAVVRLRLLGTLSAECLNVVSAASLRQLAAETMNLSVSLPSNSR